MADSYKDLFNNEISNLKEVESAENTSVENVSRKRPRDEESDEQISKKPKIDSSDSSKTSLLDDYANPNLEMGDFMAGDD